MAAHLSRSAIMVRLLAASSLCLHIHRTAAAAAADWPTICGDAAHGALNADVAFAVHHGAGAPWEDATKATVKWKHEASGEVESSPVVSATKVFSAAGKEIFALDRATGKQVWSFKTKAQVLASGALGGDLYMVGSDDHHFYALSQETGELRWKFKAGEFTGGATVNEKAGVVYVGSADGYLYAYDFQGKQVFKVQGGGAVNSSPAVDADGNVLFGDDSGTVFKVDPTGKVLWKKKFKENVRSPIVVSEQDGLYLSTGDPDGSQSGSIVRMTPAGEITWTSSCAGGKQGCQSCWTAPQPVGDVVVAGCGLDNHKLGTIWGVSREDGKLKWQIKAENDCQTSSPVHLGDGKTVVLGCTDGKLYAVDATKGTISWTFKAKKGIWATPAMDNHGGLYVASHDQGVYALMPGDRSDL